MAVLWVRNITKTKETSRGDRPSLVLAALDGKIHKETTIFYSEIVHPPMTKKMVEETPFTVENHHFHWRMEKFTVENGGVL